VVDAQVLTMIAQAVVTGGLIVAALHDVAVRTVPNRVILVVGLGALIQAFMQDRLTSSAIVGGVVLIAAGILWLRGWIGGGDAKLLAAVVPLMPPNQLPDLMLAISLTGGLLALPYLPGRRVFARPMQTKPSGLLARTLRCERWRLWRHGPLPYAVAIAAGVMLTLMRES
jgi:prepilin peptidase CpaA